MEKTVDINGVTYNTIQIGSQLWTVENLRSESHSKGVSWDNGNYGRLYDREAAMSLELPDGWRLPNDEEWAKLRPIPDGFNLQYGGYYEIDIRLILSKNKVGTWWSNTAKQQDIHAWMIGVSGLLFELKENNYGYGYSIRCVRDLYLYEYPDNDILEEVKRRNYEIKNSVEVFKRTIVDPLDLFKYSIALVNSGVTYESIEVLERQILPLLFGVKGAERLLEYLAENTTKDATEPLPTEDTYDFTGSAEVPQIIYNYGDVDELIKGDGKLFAGLKALLATLICTNLLSQNRVQVARQNVTKQPVNSRATNRKEDSEVVQALCFTAHSIICSMARYLRQDGKNPLDLSVDGIIDATRYSVNVSGKMPSNWLNIWGWF